MRTTRTKKLAAAVESLTVNFEHPCDGHEAYVALVGDEDGYMVEFGCETCGRHRGVMHPKAALGVAGADSDIGRQILAVFPEWQHAVQ